MTNLNGIDEGLVLAKWQRENTPVRCIVELSGLFVCADGVVTSVDDEELVVSFPGEDSKLWLLLDGTELRYTERRELPHGHTLSEREASLGSVEIFLPFRRSELPSGGVPRRDSVVLHELPA